MRPGGYNAPLGVSRYLGNALLSSKFWTTLNMGEPALTDTVALIFAILEVRRQVRQEKGGFMTWGLRAIAVILAATAAAMPVSALASSNLVDSINKMENRFFFRIHTSDPVEKRIERLELLVFGSVQAGNNEERVSRLSKTVQERDRLSSSRSADKDPGDKIAASPGCGKDGAPRAASQAGNQSARYPIVSTLEWRALKKTFADQTLDQRLERLEQKLFGSASTAMAYSDRVERLKKTLGVDLAENLPPARSGVGPMPKARPRQSEPLPGADLLEPFGNQPYPSFGMMPGFSGIFQEMRRQMEQRMPSGSWEWDPESGSWRSLAPEHGQVPPGSSPANPNLTPGKPSQLVPLKRRPVQVVPPYDDPNAI